MALLVAALCYWFRESGLVIGTLIALGFMVFAWRWESRFRRKQLPWEARRPWHAIAVPFVLLIPFLFTEIATRFHDHLPGTTTSLESGQLMVFGLEEGEETLDLGIKYQWKKTNWGRPVRTRSFSEIEIWPRGHENRVWVISNDLTEAYLKSNNIERVNIALGGFEKLVNSLLWPSVPPEQIKRTTYAVEQSLRLRTSSISHTSGNGWWFDRDSTRDYSSRWAWFWLAAVVFSVALFPLTCVVVGTTMYPPVVREQGEPVGAPPAPSRVA